MLAVMLDNLLTCHSKDCFLSATNWSTKFMIGQQGTCQCLMSQVLGIILTHGELLEDYSPLNIKVVLPNFCRSEHVKDYI